MTQEEIKNNRYVYSGYSDYLDQETGEIRPDFVDRLNEQDQEIKILKQALELACENIKGLYCSDWCSETDTDCENCNSKYKFEWDIETYIQEAKENKENG